MRLLLIKHFRFDDPSVIVAWALQEGHEAAVLEASDGFRTPSLDSFDWLIILGGPMSVYQEELFPWLIDEKQFVQQAAKHGKKILGICLGAQMLADVLGGKVHRSAYKEIGWHPVSRSNRKHPLFTGVPASFHSFQWHGDCFDIPPSAVPLALSEACPAQAFAYGNTVLGVQFHLETTVPCLQTMLDQWQNELVEAPYIQAKADIIRQNYRCGESYDILRQILANFARLPA